MEPLELDPVEQRVLGSLLEKERTVPDAYPLTLNALRSACNQTSGREHVVSLEPAELAAAIDRLKALGLARIVHPGSGARTTRYRQVLDEKLALGDGELAIVTLLLLRGPQTPGELRSRAERLHRFDDLDEVERALRGLRDREPPLVGELERQPGQKERRWAHLLGTPQTVATAGPALRPATGTEGVLADGPAARDERVVATYDAVATAYADRLLDELDAKPFDRWLLERLAREADGGPVADVGCGPGQVGAFVALAGSGPVTGFDLSRGMVDEARRRFPELHFQVADLRDLPPPEGSGGWSLVVGWYSLVHLAGSELGAAVGALARALRPGGRLAVAVHLGGESRRLDEWCEQEVAIDFALHDQADVLGAFAAAGLVEVEWYRRGPYAGAEAETERLYVLGRRA
jgi:uncharacterized protein